MAEARIRVLLLQSRIEKARVAKRDGRAGRDGDGDGQTGEAQRLLDEVRNFTITSRSTLEAVTGGNLTPLLAAVSDLPMHERLDMQRRLGLADWEVAQARAERARS